MRTYEAAAVRDGLPAGCDRGPVIQHFYAHGGLISYPVTSLRSLPVITDQLHGDERDAMVGEHATPA